MTRTAHRLRARRSFDPCAEGRTPRLASPPPRSARSPPRASGREQPTLHSSTTKPEASARRPQAASRTSTAPRRRRRETPRTRTRPAAVAGSGWQGGRARSHAVPSGRREARGRGTPPGRRARDDRSPRGERPPSRPSTWPVIRPRSGSRASPARRWSRRRHRDRSRSPRCFGEARPRPLEPSASWHARRAGS
jgi:hypothetical protein